MSAELKPVRDPIYAPARSDAPQISAGRWIATPERYAQIAVAEKARRIRESEDMAAAKGDQYVGLDLVLDQTMESEQPVHAASLTHESGDVLVIPPPVATGRSMGIVYASERRRARRALVRR